MGKGRGVHREEACQGQGTGRGQGEQRIQQLEKEELWRANETSAAKPSSEVRKTFLAALVTSGKSPAEIKEYLAMLEM